MSRRPLALLPLFLLLLLPACAGPRATPYQPAADSGYGYRDAWLTEDLGRVKVSGNTATDLELLQDYALYRAAELSRARGAERFALVDRENNRDREVYHEYMPSPWFSYGHFRRDYGVGYYGRPYLGVAPMTYRYTRYSTEILFRLLAPGETSDQPVYQVSEVLARLGPRVHAATAAPTS